MNNFMNQSQPQSQMQMGNASFTPYQQPNMWGNYSQQQRLPIYQAPLMHGENAAWQFPMGPNSEIYLPDADEDIIWWIRTDQMGNRTVQPFDVKPHQKQPAVDTNDLAARLAAVEEWINAKSNKPNAKRANAPTTVGVDAAT